MRHFSNEEYENTIIAQAVLIGDLRNEIAQTKRDADMYQRWYKGEQQRADKLQEDLDKLKVEK